MRNNGIFVEISANYFADPKVVRKAQVQIQISTLFAEICPDVIKNMTMIAPDFRPLFRYTDLLDCDPNAYKRIRRMVPIYILRQSMIQQHHLNSITEEMFLDIINTKVEIKVKDIPESEKLAEE